MGPRQEKARWRGLGGGVILLLCAHSLALAKRVEHLLAARPHVVHHFGNHLADTGKCAFWRRIQPRERREFCAEANVFPVFRGPCHSVSEVVLGHDFCSSMKRAARSGPPTGHTVHSAVAAFFGALANRTDNAFRAVSNPSPLPATLRKA